ncbi:MAG: hypothetical protein QFE16_17530 [Pseudomonadota bacterium]|nr:hypothetical protein [Pseudomonadota bacterium]
MATRRLKIGNLQAGQVNRDAPFGLPVRGEVAMLKTPKGCIVHVRHEE